MQARKQRGGGVPPRQKNRIRHQGKQGSEKKSGEGDTTSKRKTTNDQEGENGERPKGKEKKHYANYLGLNGGDAS